MLRAAAAGNPLLGANGDRHVELAAAHEAQLAGLIEQLVGGDERELDEHELDDRSQPGDGGASCEPDESGLGDRRVDDPLATEALVQAGGDREDATTGSDV